VLVGFKKVIKNGNIIRCTKKLTLSGPVCISVSIPPYMYRTVLPDLQIQHTGIYHTLHIVVLELPEFETLVGATVADLVNFGRFDDVSNLSNLTKTTQRSRKCSISSAQLALASSSGKGTNTSRVWH